jgi:HSP20 family protein
MNAEIFKRKWQQLRDEVKQWWEKLTADDLDSIKGERDTLVGLVQERYGYGREHAEAEVDRCLNAYDRNGGQPMAEEKQQQGSAQPDGQGNQAQGQQPAEQAAQAMQHNGGGPQTGLARRGGGMPALSIMDPFDMFRMSPFALMRRISEEMDHYFTQLGMGRSGQGMTAASSGLFYAPVEVFERDGSLMVRADLPGLTKDDVRVEITDDVLLITGERRSEHEERQDGVLRSERSYGMFRRQIPLPEGVNAEQATASFKDGVLEIAIPAPQRQARGRRLEIHSGAPSTMESQASSVTGSQAAGDTDQEGAQTTTTAGRA